MLFLTQLCTLQKIRCCLYKVFFNSTLSVFNMLLFMMWPSGYTCFFHICKNYTINYWWGKQKQKQIKNRAWWHKSIYTKVWSKNQLGLYQFIYREKSIYFMRLNNMVTDGFGKLENNSCMFKQLIVPITHYRMGHQLFLSSFWCQKCWIQLTPSQCWSPKISVHSCSRFGWKEHV